ncbi:MAG: phospholipid transport system substrate-binding protein [Arenicella sp.]|jgi:phospholipid transport system substrate-binding protein
MNRTINNRLITSFRTVKAGLLCKSLMVGSLLLFSNASFAMQAPDEVVKTTVNQIINNIQANRAAYSKDSQKLYAMVEQVLVPTLHVDRMSSLILGKSARSATAAQKKAFSDEFKTFLMRTYAIALLEYTGDEDVIFEPIDLAPGADKVTIRATLVATDGQRYPVNLFMSNRRDTKWRAYNMEVAKINFVATYRNTFGDIITKKGVDGLIAELRAKNARSAG